MLERSKGKLRPGLARASDLPVPQSPPDRRQGRDEHGRFAPGHASTRGRGWRRAVRSMLPAGVTDAAAVAVANDAASLFRAVSAELPADGPAVGPLVAEHARSAVAASWAFAEASRLGLATSEGRALLELSMRLGQRAERTIVTAFDLATRLRAARAQKGGSDTPWLVPAAGSSK